MQIKIVRDFHVFVPNDGRDKKVAFTAGTMIGAADLPVGQTAQDWIDKGLAVSAGAASEDDGAEAGDAV